MVPSIDEKTLKSLFAATNQALDSYYNTNKSYPTSLKELTIDSKFAPYLIYVRTGNSSCTMVYFSLGNLDIDSPSSYQW